MADGRFKLNRAFAEEMYFCSVAWPA